MNRPEASVADLTVAGLLDGVASGEVTPSGGALAAVGGAAGAALCEMACIHTLDHADGDAGVGPESELTAARTDLESHRGRLLDLADEDVAAVEAVQAALGGDADEKERATRRATEVPLETAEACLAVVEAATVVTAESSRAALADAGTGAQLAGGALRASIYTVRTNLGTVSDAAFVTRTADRADDVEAAGERALGRVEATLQERR